MHAYIISNVFACETNRVLNDFVDSCVLASVSAWEDALCKTRELYNRFKFIIIIIITF